MKKKAVNDPVARFVSGNKQTKTPTPKSLTPKVKASGDKKRAGLYGKSVPY